MINTSNEYKKRIMESRVFYAKAIIDLANSTQLILDNSDIFDLKVEDGTSANDSFQIGSAIINKLTLNINNTDEKFSKYDFTGAIIRPSIGLQLSSTIETLYKGVFTVDKAISVGGTIQITALDNLNKFDTPFSNVTITFPCNALQLLQAVSLHCGVSLATSSFTNSTFMINRRPSDEATTCREIVAWIGQLSGNFARCNVNGALELKWYDIGAFESGDNVDGGVFDNATPYASGDNVDGGNFTDYNSGDAIDGGTFLDMDKYHHIYALQSATISTDDVIITGIQVKAMGIESDYNETVLFGSNGYVIEISNNPLIQEGNASVIANTVGAKIVGMKFRPLSISALSDPSIEAGDVAMVSDRKRNSYQILITNSSYTIGNYQSISCDAETLSKKQSYRPDPTTKSIVEARKVAKQEISSYDLAVQQLTSVALNSMGYYPTTIIQADGSRIDYAHDKPTLAESRIVYKKTIDGFFISKDGGTTYTSGFTADGNILANVLTAIGIKAEWLVVGGTISGLRIEASTGKIGPYNISTSGLTSNTMQFFDDNTYPLIWMEKPGFSQQVSGSAKANYEPSVAVVRSIEDGIETDVRMIARDDTQGNKGKVSIERIDLATSAYKSLTELTESGIEWTQYENGAISSSMQISNNAVVMNIGGQYASIVLSGDTGDLQINATGDVYINGIKQ